MKTKFLPGTKLLAFAVVLAAGAGHLMADSKRTAEYLLTDPKSHEGDEVTLDVSMVKPVRWVSPLPDYSFFHALTIDRTDGRPGGGILVAIPTAEAAAFAKKYGTDFEGRNDKTTLRGKLAAIGGQPPQKIWMVDTTGQLESKMQELRKSLPADAAMAGEGFGPGAPGGPLGPGGRPQRPVRPGAGS